MNGFYIKDISNIRDDEKKVHPYIFIVRTDLSVSVTGQRREELTEFVEQIIEWCREHLGDRGTGAWYYQNYEIMMDDPNKAFEFKMRWVTGR